MLNGRGEQADRIVGLELGADDYLPKTSLTHELLARLRAVIRRSNLARLQEEPVEACGGTVQCRNRSPKGLEAEIRLPPAKK
jgi:DNA-binding response OmpR family regulator